MSYVKYCERRLYAAENALVEALCDGDPRRVAQADFEVSLAGQGVDWAYAEEAELFEEYDLAEEEERQAEAWAGYEYATYLADLDDAYPAWRYDDVPADYRGRLVA